MPPVLYSPYSTLVRVTWPIWHTWGSHMTNIELSWSHMMNITHFSRHTTNSNYTSLRIYWDDTFSNFRGCIRLGWKREAAAFTSCWWLFEPNWQSPSPCLTLHKWQSPFLRLIRHPVVNPPTQKYISIRAWRGVLYVNSGTRDAVSIDNTALG